MADTKKREFSRFALEVIICLLEEALAGGNGVA